MSTSVRSSASVCVSVKVCVCVRVCADASGGERDANARGPQGRGESASRGGWLVARKSVPVLRQRVKAGGLTIVKVCGSLVDQPRPNGRPTRLPDVIECHDLHGRGALLLLTVPMTLLMSN